MFEIQVHVYSIPRSVSYIYYNMWQVFITLYIVFYYCCGMYYSVVLLLLQVLLCVEDPCKLKQGVSNPIVKMFSNTINVCLI